MSNSDEISSLPAPITAAIAGITAALVPASVKALDRLLGAAVDIPVAWLEYQKAKIVSKTEAFRTIDGAITKSAATKAEANEQFADRALDSLVRKSYRHLGNKEAVSSAMLEDLRDSPPDPVLDTTHTTRCESANIDDDWLNVFERYAEDASTERMQRLWGRVLAGEVRSPGKYAMRTLRFLSEFSQADALSFSSLCHKSFGDMVPKKLALSPDKKDMRDILYMEASGLIQGTGGMGLQNTTTFNENGIAFLRENSLVLVFLGEPNTSFSYEVLALTPLGQELVTLRPGRDARAAARTVGTAIRSAAIKSAYIAVTLPDGSATTMEILWKDEPPAPVIDA